MSEQHTLIPDNPPSQTYAVVNLSDIVPDHELLGDDPDAAFVRNIEKYGVIHNVGLLVITESHPKHRVLYGRKRIKSQRQLGRKTIPSFIYSVDDGVGAVMTMIENEQRKPNIATDLDAIEVLTKQGASDDDICLAVGMAKGTLNSRKRLLRLVPELRSALKEHRILESAATEAARLSEDDQRTLATSDRIRVKDVRSARNRKRKQVEATLPKDLFSTPGIPAEPITEVVASDSADVPASGNGQTITGVAVLNRVFNGDRAEFLVAESLGEQLAAWHGIPITITIEKRHGVA